MICPSGPDIKTIPPGCEALGSGDAFQNINQKNTNNHTTKISCRLTADVYVKMIRRFKSK
jgi:hypothetical protein